MVKAAHLRSLAFLISFAAANACASSENDCASEYERGNKVGTWMVEQTLSLPSMPLLRRWVLFTQDAQDLYCKFGFENPVHPERVMERHDA